MKCITLILFTLTTFIALGQDTNTGPLALPKNSIQAELLGNGLLYSVSYERMLVQKAHFKISGRIGLSYVPNIIGDHKSTDPALGAISEINLLIGRQRTYLEIGSGFTYWQNFSANKNTGFYVPRIGIRYLTKNKRYMVRIGFTPLINIPMDSRLHVTPKFFPFGGIAFGFLF